MLKPDQKRTCNQLVAWPPHRKNNDKESPFDPTKYKVKKDAKVNTNQKGENNANCALLLSKKALTKVSDVKEKKEKKKKKKATSPRLDNVNDGDIVNLSKDVATSLSVLVYLFPNINIWPKGV